MNSVIRPTIHVYDVDGTLLRKDSLQLLVSFVCSKPADWLRLILGLVPAAFSFSRSKGKEKLVGMLLAGMQKQEIEDLGMQFFQEVLRNQLYQDAIGHIRSKQLLGEATVLLSASCDAWLKPLAGYLGCQLICTMLAYDDAGQFKGKFSTPNCRGVEKVKRLSAEFDPEVYSLVCYADAPSDRPLKKIASAFHVKPFNN